MMNVEQLYWNYENYSLLLQFGVFANIWLTQIAGVLM